MRNLLSLLVLVATAPAAVADPPSGLLGARARGLGGAFTAVADDITSFYWNPAGVARGAFVRAGAFWATDFRDPDEVVEHLRTALPGEESVLRTSRAAGLSAGFTILNIAATRFTTTATELDGATLRSRGLEATDLVVTFVQSLPPDDLIVGVNVHYLRGTTFDGSRPAAEVPPGGETVGELARWATGSAREAASESEPGVDVGVLYQPAEWVRLGLTARNLTRPSFRVEGEEEIVLEAHARTGVALFLPGGALVAVDLDLSEQEGMGPGRGFRELAVGVEKPLREGRITLRGGVLAELGGGGPPMPGVSAGVGLAMGRLRLDVAATSATRSRRGALSVGVSFVR